MKLSLARRCLVTATAATLVFGVANAASADNVAVDNDTASGLQHSVSLTAAPGATVFTTAGQVVSWQGSNHLQPSSAIVVSMATVTGDALPGLAVADATGTVPANWNDSSDEFTVISNISFTAPTTPGIYQTNIKFLPSTFTCAPSGAGCLSAVATGDPLIIDLTVQGSTSTPNTAPAVAFTSAPTVTNEGTNQTFSFSITDPDAADTHTFASGYPNCGSGNAVVSSSIDDTAHSGTFVCSFPDGLVPAVLSTVTAQVSDGTAASNVASTTITVNNVNPAVAAPSFAASSVNCRISATLSGISFSDAGVNDANWTVDIDWGDGSTHTSVIATAQGPQGNQSHTYTTPGTYTATVRVTDKDTGAGSNNSSNQIQVLQVYNTTFLPPFDGSSPSRLIVNTMKNGRVVPVKVTIYDVCTQAWVTSPATVTVKVTKTSGTAGSSPDPVETYADAGASSANTSAFRWTSDATAPGGGFWIYNLDSKALALIVNNFYRVDAYVGSNLATGTTWGILQPVK